MRILIALVATLLLVPAWYGMLVGVIPFLDGKWFGMPAGVVFVLLEMTALVGLCWVAMRQVEHDTATPTRES